MPCLLVKQQPLDGFDESELHCCGCVVHIGRAWQGTTEWWKFLVHVGLASATRPTGWRETSLTLMAFLAMRSAVATATRSTTRLCCRASLRASARWSRGSSSGRPRRSILVLIMKQKEGDCRELSQSGTYWPSTKHSDLQRYLLARSHTTRPSLLAHQPATNRPISSHFSKSIHPASKRTNLKNTNVSLQNNGTRIRRDRLINHCQEETQVCKEPDPVSAHTTFHYKYINKRARSGMEVVGRTCQGLQ